jgi:hypothetical protein
MKVTAVFQCTRKEQTAYGTELNFTPPYCVDKKPGEPRQPDETYEERWQRVNEGWSAATPNGALSMTVTNPAALEQFEQGQYYLLSFEKFEG